LPSYADRVISERHLREDVEAEEEDHETGFQCTCCGLFGKSQAKLERERAERAEQRSRKREKKFSEKLVLKEAEDPTDLAERKKLARRLDLENCCYQCIEGCDYRICGHCYAMNRGEMQFWTDKTEPRYLPFMARLRYAIIYYLGLALEPSDYLESDRIMQEANSVFMCAQELNRRRFNRAQMQGLTSESHTETLDTFNSRKLLDYDHVDSKKPDRGCGCCVSSVRALANRNSKLSRVKEDQDNLRTALQRVNFQPLRGFDGRSLTVRDDSTDLSELDLVEVDMSTTEREQEFQAAGVGTSQQSSANV